MQITPHAESHSGELIRQAAQSPSKSLPAALEAIVSARVPRLYPAGAILFCEHEPAPGVFVIRGGEVKLSMNSSDGRRLSLRIERAGGILGLTSALSGNPCEMTAEILTPAKIVPIRRQEFLNFLLRHPEMYQTVSQELSQQYNLACEQLRTVGLASTAPEKLARLLLAWSEHGQKTDGGIRVRFALTHEEIGEFIGASRETVTRALSVFRLRKMVTFSGSTLTISNRNALESCARV